MDQTRPNSAPYSFYSDVFPDELKIIEARRNARNLDVGLLRLARDRAGLPRAEAGLVGLALSGGGIRSATFNLGILQALAKVQNEKSSAVLLSLFDYLSTVSGGGYIGCWLAAWMRNTDAAGVERELRGKHRHLICESKETPEPAQIQHLRDYSNYIMARLGLLSADTWSTIAAYVRNAFLNLLIIAPLLAAILLLPRLSAKLIERPGFLSEVVAVPAFLLTALAIWTASYAAARPTLSFSRRMLHWLVIIPLVLSAGLLLWLPLGSLSSAPLTLAGIVFGSGWAVSFIGLNAVAWMLYWPADESRGAARRRGWAIFTWWAAVIVGGLVAGILFGKIFVDLHRYWSNEPGHLVVWGPPMALLLFVAALNVQLGIRGKYESDPSREWWASMSGWLLVYAVAWWVVGAISVYGPLLFELFRDRTKTQYAMIAGWIATTLGAIFSGFSPKTGGLKTDGGSLSSWLDYASRILAPLAVIGLLVVIAIGLHVLPSYLFPDHSTPPPAHGTLEPGSDVSAVAGSSATVNVASDKFGTYWKEFKRPSVEQLGLLLLLSLVIGVGMGVAIDVNEFSLHAVYRNRLIRCYLRAVRRKASEPRPRLNLVTDLDPDDDHPLADLGVEVVDLERPPYVGPYLLINTALNLTDPRRLGWQERKAAAFLLSPLYCGSNLTGYRQTRVIADAIKLGTAMAISGAAYTSNMGYHSSRALGFFLSMFNVRLGWWIGNPARDKYATQGPRWGLLYLLVELLGRANEDRDYVYLSDGGHFDNLGLYELIRRRCRYIVCCDAGEDGDYSFSDLGMAIRKIRADFGVDIEIDLDMIKPQSEGAYSRRHHAIGTIRYDLVDRHSPVGTLVYIKTSLVGDEPADVLEYRAQHGDFPHETTLDQFFSESQFEAYRALGEHVGIEVFRYAKQEL